jgi:GGDEF domain-containing protein
MDLPDASSTTARLDELLAGGSRPALFLIAVDGHDELAVADADGTRAAMDEVVRRLDHLVRSSDLLGAVCPGTFLLVGSGVDPSVAGALVERIQGAVALPLEVGGGPVSLRVDVGLAFADGGSSGAQLLARATDDLRRIRRT